MSLFLGSDIDKIAPALVKALGELADPTKAGKAIVKSERAVYGYTYLELSDLLAEVRRVFAAHGLAVLQSPEYADGTVRTITMILHESGQLVTTPTLVIRSNPDAQSIGSAISYSRRYQLAALVGLVGSNDDDDGARATHPGPAPQDRYAQTRPVTREQGSAAHPDPRWTQPPTPPGEPPPDHPIDDTSRPELGAPSTTHQASDKSIKMMWALIRKRGLDADQVRTWVGNVLGIDPDWHTDNLTQFQVSAVIDRLKSTPEPP